MATELIRQRADDDCTICSIAMATGISYERVLEVASVTRLGYRYKGARGTYSALQVLGALGVEAVRSYWWHDKIERADLVTPLCWGRRAILSVPSLNGFAGYHDVFWDGAHLLDPTPGRAYPDGLDGLTLLGLLAFDERR